MESDMRIDKWLWCVRIYKTRTLATEACNAGKVRINDIEVKPSKHVSLGDIITVKQNPIIKTLEVRELPKSRVGAKMLEEHVGDITPEEEYDKIEMLRLQKTEWRDKSIGRPTKKDRREIDRFKGLED